ncbi:hypothetical protein [Streptomyces sp. NPDC050287]|uniref:hypothetical protein n=1 Tax=Streptomyces sp. NPDC050287 TaxID=3365608 RepID=UPI0037A4E9F2
MASHTGGTPRTWREHRQVRAAAQLRRSAAQNELNHLQRQLGRDLRILRRHGETTAIVTRSRLAEIGLRGLIRLAARTPADR